MNPSSPATPDIGRTIFILRFFPLHFHLSLILPCKVSWPHSLFPFLLCSLFSWWLLNKRNTPAGQQADIGGLQDLIISILKLPAFSLPSLPDPKTPSPCITPLSPVKWDEAERQPSIREKDMKWSNTGEDVGSSRGSSQPRDGTHVSCVFCTGRRILYHWVIWKAQA